MTSASPILSEDDPFFPHLLRMMGVAMAVGLSSVFVIGLFWYAHIFSRTGFRKRDVGGLFVPVLGAYLSATALWRYTARDAYWMPRDDRPSVVLHGWQRPAAIALGWIGMPIFVVVVGVVAVLTAGWSDADRSKLVNNFVQLGVDRPAAECMADQIIEAFPSGPDSYADDSEVSDAVDEAVDACAPG